MFRRLLEEKQKVRFNYGVTETQLRRYFAEAQRLPGKTGDNLLGLLERRLDNVVFRLGFAPTIPAARQLVSHGHVRVNGKKVDRASFLAEVGETVSLPEGKIRERAGVLESVTRGPQVRIPGVPRARSRRQVHGSRHWIALACGHSVRRERGSDRGVLRAIDGASDERKAGPKRAGLFL